MKTYSIILAIILISCQGQDGEIGPVGSSSLINLIDEPAGPNCSNGGVKIESGIDNNKNNTLDLSEVTSTKYVCTSQSGDPVYSSLVATADEGPGDNCLSGGLKMELGMDLNRNNILDESEKTSTKYLCKNEYDYDNLERIEFGGDFGNNSTTWLVSPHETFNLIKFNKLDYATVDSITFVGSLFITNSGATCSVELYNLTDEVPIENSLLESSTEAYIFKESENIFDQLPDKEITLAVRLKTNTQHVEARTGVRSFLFIYRKG
jgi:hypothetical protein